MESLWDELPGSSGGRRLEILFELGAHCGKKSEYLTAVTLWTEAVDLATELEWAQQRFDAVNNLMWCHDRLDQWSEVERLMERHTPDVALTLSPESAEYFFRTCGFYYRDQRMAREAIWSFHSAEEYARTGELNYHVTRAMTEQANLHVLLREYNEARTMFLDALSYAREKGGTFIAPIIQVQLGLLYIELRDYRSAVEVLREALHAIEAMGDEDLKGTECKRGLATAYLRLGRVNDARLLLTELDTEIEPFLARDRAELMLLNSEAATSPEEAEEFRNRARALAVNNGAQRVVNVCDINSALDAQNRGDWATAERLLRQVVASTELVDDEVIANDARVRLAVVLLETQRADEALALLRAISVVNFFDATTDGLRYALTLAAALVEVGELDEAESTLGPIIARPREWDTLAATAEAYWILSLIAEARAGRDATWERFLGISTALSLQAGDAHLAATRSETLAQLDAPMPVDPIRSVEEFVATFDEPVTKGEAPAE